MRSAALFVLAPGVLVLAALGLHQSSTASSSTLTAQARDALPLAGTSYVLGDDIDAYAAFMMSGGPPPDGIP